MGELWGSREPPAQKMRGWGHSVARAEGRTLWPHAGQPCTPLGWFHDSPASPLPNSLSLSGLPQSLKSAKDRRLELQDSD